MSRLRARRHGALILMGVWCGALMADTTQRKTGVRLRRPVGGWSVPSGTQPKKVVQSYVREKYCLLTGAF
jgi:hypothetical protein